MIAQCLNGPVQAGDMVRVVLPTMCCGDRDCIGQEFRVSRIIEVEARCNACGAGYVGLACEERAYNGSPTSLVIRIDPPALPESIETEREVTA